VGPLSPSLSRFIGTASSPGTRRARGRRPTTTPHNIATIAGLTHGLQMRRSRPAHRRGAALACGWPRPWLRSRLPWRTRRRSAAGCARGAKRHSDRDHAGEGDPAAVAPAHPRGTSLEQTVGGNLDARCRLPEPARRRTEPRFVVATKKGMVADHPLLARCLRYSTWRTSMPGWWAS